MSNNPNKFIDAVDKAIKTVPNLYDDTFKPPAKESGKILERIPRLINAALAPLDIWIRKREFNVQETEKILSKKLQNVAEEKIVTPEPYVAVPALQAISYSMDSKELRELYANLLAKSMQVDTKDTVHPSFVEIIRQLSPFDAQLLNSIFQRNYPSYPIVCTRLQISHNNFEGVNIDKHILSPKFGVDISNYKNYAISIDNLIRLNVIDVTYTSKLAAPDAYLDIENSTLINYLQQEYEKATQKKYPYFTITKGVLSSTDLGNSFAKICLK